MDKQITDSPPLGFNLVIVIIALITIVALGFVGWRVWDSNRNTSDTRAPQTEDLPNQTNNNQSDHPVQQADPNEGYIIIEEWGVRLPLGAGLVGMAYTMELNRQFAHLTTARLIELSTTHAACADADKSVSIARAKPGDDHLGSPWLESQLANIGTKVGEYYYYPQLGQPCANDPGSAVLEKIGSIREALIEAVKKVEIIQ